MVCFIHRPEAYGIKEDTQGRDLTGLAEIIVAKHRNGPTGDLWLAFKNIYIRFENINEAGVRREYTSKMNSIPESSTAAMQPVNNNEDFITQRSYNLTPY
jgi:replicative DNA helicase